MLKTASVNTAGIILIKETSASGVEYPKKEKEAQLQK